MTRWWRRRWPLLAAAVAGFALGIAAGGLWFWAHRPDDSFWRDFFTGPPMGGVFALVGAGIAFLAGHVTARVTRQGNARREWWERAEWALTLAISRSGTHRDVGLRALTELVGEATPTEAGMIDAVTSVVLNVGTETLAEDHSKPHNGDRRRRWWPWQ